MSFRRELPPSPSCDPHAKLRAQAGHVGVGLQRPGPELHSSLLHEADGEDVARSGVQFRVLYQSPSSGPLALEDDVPTAVDRCNYTSDRYATSLLDPDSVHRRGDLRSDPDERRRADCLRARVGGWDPCPVASAPCGIKIGGPRAVVDGYGLEELEHCALKFSFDRDPIDRTALFESHRAGQADVLPVVHLGPIRSERHSGDAGDRGRLRTWKPGSRDDVLRGVVEYRKSVGVLRLGIGEEEVSGGIVVAVPVDPALELLGVRRRGRTV